MSENNSSAVSRSCDVALLERIYRDARIGAETTDTLLSHTSSPALAATMIRQMYRYRAFAHAAKEQLQQRGAEPKPMPPLSRLGIRASTAAHTLLDESSSHIAELMINGSTMGVIDMTKAVRTIPGSREIRELGKDMIRFEEDSIQNMKRYLY